MELVNKEVNKIDQEKINRDLGFAKAMDNFLTKKGFRLVVSGGYATDGNLGKITRPHKDLDLIIYSSLRFDGDEFKKILKELSSDIPFFADASTIIKEREEYYQPIVINKSGFWVDIYWVEIKGDSESEYQVVKKDGALGDKRQLRTHKGALNGIEFEFEPAEQRLADILSKGKGVGTEKAAKFEQDVVNLQKLINRE